LLARNAGEGLAIKLAEAGTKACKGAGLRLAMDLAGLLALRLLACCIPLFE